ncbi:hypothetical protein EDB80DRAFT_739016, partial [Ilyonectria destructans]
MERGSFSYDKKGPCHCWTPETAAEKKAATDEELKPLIREEWELSNRLRRLHLRQLPGPKPMWRWNSNTGKLTRGVKGGIDWYRYQTIILIPKMFPFAKECTKTRPQTVVQEDKAPAHNHYIQQRVYNLHQ